MAAVMASSALAGMACARGADLVFLTMLKDLQKLPVICGRRKNASSKRHDCERPG
jgi:hypothetical protein